MSSYKWTGWSSPRSYCLYPAAVDGIASDRMHSTTKTYKPTQAEAPLWEQADRSIRLEET
jgi:hypothetical protein